MKKISKLEAIRGFAAVYVVCHHLFAKGLHIGRINIGAVFAFGQEAVILFFLLSGFVVRLSYLQSQDKSLSYFLLKRSLRIFIPLLIVFACNYLLFHWEGIHARTGTAKILLGNLLMLQDTMLTKPNVVFEPFLGNAPLWSLSYEWWFYMLFAFLIGCKQDNSRLVYRVSVLAAVTYLWHPNFINRELMYLAIWWIGSDMAGMYYSKQTISIAALRMPLLYMVLLVTICVIQVALQKNLHGFGASPAIELRHFAFAFLAVLLALFWHGHQWKYFSTVFGVFEKIAPVSFVLYISHWFLLVRVSYLDHVISNSVVRGGMYLVVCVFFSFLVERKWYPFLHQRVMRVVKPEFAPAPVIVQ